ncbi:MAG: hypothetical protein CL912_32655 [Deltaproteobacteria bacterium]|nr:hypothetical protein [Deltaproteobacteria bacterium]
MDVGIQTRPLGPNTITLIGNAMQCGRHSPFLHHAHNPPKRKEIIPSRSLQSQNSNPRSLALQQVTALPSYTWVRSHENLTIAKQRGSEPTIHGQTIGRIFLCELSGEAGEI